MKRTADREKKTTAKATVARRATKKQNRNNFIDKNKTAGPIIITIVINITYHYYAC